MMKTNYLTDNVLLYAYTLHLVLFIANLTVNIPPSLHKNTQ